MKQKHKSLTDSHSAFDDSSFSLTDDQAGASFIRSFQLATIAATAPDEIHPAAMPSEAPVGSMPAAISAQASLSGFTSVPITLGGITINLLFNVAAMSAPESFRQGIEQAATLLASAITDRITVNITIDYSGTGGGAMAKPIGVHPLSYTTVRQDLIRYSGAIFGDILPATSSIQGQSSVDVYNAQKKLWGLLGANDTTTADGNAIFNTDIPLQQLTGMALHELTHVLGRTPVISMIDTKVPNVFDLFRFTSPGVRLFQSSWDNSHPAPAAYFSVDGGFTRAADYGQFNDPGDFFNGGVQGSDDPFNEISDRFTKQFLTAVDILQLDVLGFHVGSTLPVTVIDNAGSTRMEQVGRYFYLDPANGAVGSGAVLHFDDEPVYQGRMRTFHNVWVPIGAEEIGNGFFEVAWKIGDSYKIWIVNNWGNYLWNGGNGNLMSANSWDLISAEFSFRQDLNGDGLVGFATIEAAGSTRLEKAASTYFLDPAGGGQGPVLKYQGAPVTPGQFGAWTPIAAEQTAGGYDVAWKMIGIDLFTVWSTDASGNYITNIIGTVSGASFDLQSIETTFKQDLNGDGFIGLPYIEALGSTRLDQFGSNYYLDPVSGGTGPLLRYQGAAIVAGQFGSWTPIGAERTASGYEVAWKVTGANQYSIWNTDSNGNRVSSADALTGTSLVLKAAEVRFHQDLNGDGIIGIAPTTIEAFGSTKLDLAGSAYSLDPGTGGGSGPTLKWQGVAVVPGQFNTFAPIGAEQTAGGYEVAWKAAGADQYSIWTTDNNGNFVSDMGALTGTSLALKAAEVRFHQDLNGDGRIGIAPTTIETFGSTKLDLAGAAYSLDPVAGGGTGPTLKWHGVAVIPGQFPTFNPIGAEKTATGYEVAWKATGADQYSIWITDSNGNYISDGGRVSGTSTTLETAETRFHQDLNGDGVIGVPTAHAAVSMPAASALAGDSFVFSPDLGTNSALASANFNALDAQSPSSGPLPAFSFSGPAAALEMLFHQVNDSYDPFVSQDQPSPLLHLTDLHGGAVFIL